LASLTNNSLTGIKMEKIDYKKVLKHLYNPSPKEPVIVVVPKMNYLTIEGQGDPNTSEDFKEAVEALFALSYALKFMIKKGEQQVDYGVMPLEGLWWADNIEEFTLQNKNNWKWRLMMMQPELIVKDLVQETLKAVEKKKNPPALPKLKFEEYDEGKSAQIMHVGPFSEEGPTVARLHQFIEDNGNKLHGFHHEIYINDMRRTAPEKLKTVLRQPFK
jgi:hypothetical protein